ncbi:MAG: SIMPL domain-containing protein [Actinomycetia bacterium]|nr:SIMPL domain-containing protein [Actinomycetes bacterium]
MSSILPSCVDVIGTGTANATPDMVHVDLRATREGSSVSETLRAVDEVITTVRAVLTDAGVAAKDIATTSTGIHQRYDNQGQPTSGFTAYHTLRVGVRDLDQVSGLVDRAVAAAEDALLIDGITLSIADPAPLLAQARENAFADARARAEEYARFAGRTLGAVSWIGDHVTSGPGPRMYAMRDGAAEASMSIAPGESTLTAQLAVRWTWADAEPTRGDHSGDAESPGGYRGDATIVPAAQA